MLFVDLRNCDIDRVTEHFYGYCFPPCDPDYVAQNIAVARAEMVHAIELEAFLFAYARLQSYAVLRLIPENPGDWFAHRLKWVLEMLWHLQITPLDQMGPMYASLAFCCLL